MAEGQKSDPRLTEVVEDLLATLRGFIRKHRITHDEYRQAVGFMLETAAKDYVEKNQPWPKRSEPCDKSS